MNRRVKLGQILLVSTILASLMLTFITSPAMAAGNGTTVGDLELAATFECISVYSNFSDDDNSNNQTTVEYREADGSWKPAHPLVVDRRQEIYDRWWFGRDGQEGPNPFANQWRGSIIGLEPGTEYEVRVTYTDPDGIAGTDSVVGSIRTRDEDIPLGTGNTYYVATDGDDANPGTEAEPFGTIQHAADIVAAGDTVYIKGGTYVPELTEYRGSANHGIIITTSGTPDNYITFQNYNGEEVIIEGNDIAAALIAIDMASYVRIRGLTIQNAYYAGIKLTHEANYNIIESCVFHNCGHANPHAAIEINLGAANTLIQYNHFDNHNNDYGDNRHRANGVCLGFWQGYSDDHGGPGPGTVIRYNTFDGTADRGLGDAVGGQRNDDIRDGLFKDADCYGNYVVNTNSEGIEVEGGDINVRVWDNWIQSTYTSGVGFAPVKIGPLYVFRNTNFDPVERQEIAIKCGWGKDYGGRAYVYHNTFWLTRSSRYGISDWGGGGGVSNHVYRNNIVVCAKWPINLGQGPVHDFDMDYDCLFDFNSDIAQFRFNDVYYDGLPELQTGTGQEMYGISSEPLFTDPDNNDLTLQEDSPCIDAGEIIVGFNDPDGPYPYVGSAPDVGCFEYPSYYLSLNVTPPGLLTMGGAGWYAAGTKVTTETSPETIPTGSGTRYVFMTWLVDDIERVGNPISVTMDSPHRVAAHYKTQHYLAAESEYGELQETGWYDDATLVTTGTASELVMSGNDTRYVFITWLVDDVEKVENPITVIMETPHRATASYKTQYYLAVESEYGEPEGAGWYDSGSAAIVSVPNVKGLIIQHFFTGWSGDVTKTAPVANITMNKPLTIVANWRTDYSRLYLLAGVIVILAGFTSLMLVKRKNRA
jgi:hypothetical protein